MSLILLKEWLNENVVKLRVDSIISQKCKPGQFVMIRVSELGERIPLTIYDYSRHDNYIELIFQIVGVTTDKLSHLDVGDKIMDLLGPLGNPISSLKENKVLVVAGGLGIVPMLAHLKKVYAKTIDGIYGVKKQDSLVLLEELRECVSNLSIFTEDGSYGSKGYVSNDLAVMLTNQKYDHVIAIGPIPMMSAVVDITKRYNIPTSVSLNPIMVDGTGMCGGCRVKVSGEVKFACIDGPEFEGLEVDFDELIIRSNIYTERGHNCVCEK